MAKHRPFRFGTGCWSARSRREYLDNVRQIEEMGYSVLLSADHLGDQLGPLTALMAAADASTLRICAFVLSNDFRNPAFLAKEVGTLDVLSEGRFELGLGAGWLGSDYTGSGIQMEPHTIRFSRLNESLQVIKGLLSDAPVDYSGQYYSVQGLDGTPKPAQRPYPPLFIGGAGKKILSLAGQEADIVGLAPHARGGDLDWSHLGSATVARQIDWVRRAAGDRFPALELSTLVFKVVITDHPREAAEEIAPSLDVTPEQVLESIQYLVGTVDGIAEEVSMWRERYGISYITVLQEERHAFAPVVSRLAGT